MVRPCLTALEGRARRADRPVGKGGQAPPVLAGYGLYPRRGRKLPGHCSALPRRACGSHAERNGPAPCRDFSRDRVLRPESYDPDFPPGAGTPALGGAGRPPELPPGLRKQFHLIQPPEAFGGTAGDEDAEVVTAWGLGQR